MVVSLVDRPRIHRVIFRLANGICHVVVEINCANGDWQRAPRKTDGLRSAPDSMDELDTNRHRVDLAM